MLRMLYHVQLVPAGKQIKPLNSRLKLLIYKNYINWKKDAITVIIIKYNKKGSLKMRVVIKLALP